jgi:hypothetical protein
MAVHRGQGQGARDRPEVPLALKTSKRYEKKRAPSNKYRKTFRPSPIPSAPRENSFKHTEILPARSLLLPHVADVPACGLARPAGRVQHVFDADPNRDPQQNCDKPHNW